MTRPRKYTPAELRALQAERAFRAAEAATVAAEAQAVQNEIDHIVDTLADDDPLCAGLIVDFDAWMPRATIAEAYYAATPDSVLSVRAFYGALREGECREAKRRGTWGFLGHRPADAEPSDEPAPNVSGPPAALARLQREGFLGTMVDIRDGSWITRADVLTAALDWSARSGTVVSARDLYAALDLLPGVDPAKRKGTRGFRGLTRITD